jgi:hypothetical protein
MRQRPRWSPNGRYLAFVALLIEWSPDGTRIVMQELLNDFEFLFDPHSKPPSSVWSVSVSTGEIQLLYSTGEAFAGQTILYWLDDQRFIAYEGFLGNADQARNLRLVDMEAGTSRVLFNGVFVAASFDPVHEVFVIFEQGTEKCLPGWICLVSLKDGTIRIPQNPPAYMSSPSWDEDTGVFLSGEPCENDPQRLQALDYRGNFICVLPLAPTPTQTSVEAVRYPAPNGQSSVSVKDGLWLETEGKPAVQLSQQAASNVIWCPDSNCFFFFTPQQDHTLSLYRVSVPDLTVNIVDEGIEFPDGIQWLGGEE